MAQTAANAVVGVEGSVYIAPTGTAAPTDADGALNAAFKEVGFLGEDGVTINHDDETTELKAWQRGTVVRKPTTSSDITIEFGMIERNKTAVELFYKKTLEVGDDALTEAAPPSKIVSMVIDVIDGTKIHRMYCPSCEVTERGEITIANEEFITYPVTMTAYEDGSNVKVYHFWDAALT